MAKGTEGNGGLKQPLPPLVLCKNPGEHKKEMGPKPLWLDKEAEGPEQKQFFKTKGQFDYGKKENRDGEEDDIIIPKATMSQAYRFPK